MTRRYDKRSLILPLALFLVLLMGVASILLGENFRQVGGSDVYRMAQPDAEALARITERYGIVSLLNLRGANPDKAWYRQETEAAKRLGLEMRDIPLSSRELPDFRTMARLVESLTGMPRPLLVHCQHGRDRSGLAAIILRLLAADGTLEQAWAEVSIWRGVIHSDSVGRRFLAQYQRWLAAKGRGHDAATFRAFLEQGYRDPDHNLWIVVDRINEERYRGQGERPLTLDRDLPWLQLSGWAFDPIADNPPKGVEILWGEHSLGHAEMGVIRRDVVHAYNAPPMEGSGWRLRAGLDGELAGCEDLYLRLTRADGEVIRSSSKARICFD